MTYSVVVLAGGFSKRFGKDKGLVKLGEKPLILHVLDKVSKIGDEKLVVVSSETQAQSFSKVIRDKAKIVIDESKTQSPLVGALTGFKNANNKYILLLPCDTPFISSQIAALLLELCINRSTTIPRWPNGYIEPLQAAYYTKSALAAAETALKQGKLKLQDMIALMRNVRYISTLVLKQLDPKLQTFFNINTLQDLKKAELRLK